MSDFSVLRRQLCETPTTYVAAPAAVIDCPRIQATPAIDFRIPSDLLWHRFVEIRASQRGHKLVTLIEIVSPLPTSKGRMRA